MEALTDIFPTILERMVPHLHVHIAQALNPRFAFLGPEILTKSDQYYTRCEVQRLDEVIIWQLEVFNKVLQHSQSLGRKPDKTITYTLKKKICWGKFFWEKDVLQYTIPL